MFPNTEFLPSPYSILGSATVEGFEPVDLSNMLNEEYRLLLLLASQSGRIDDPDRKYGMNGIFQSLYPDADAAIAKLWKRGYLRKLTTVEIMKSFSIADLRHAASLVGVKLKSRLKRAELYNVMVEYAKEKPVIEFAETRKWLKLSDKGLLLAKSLYAERNNLEKAIFQLFLKKEDQKAIALWDAYKARQGGYEFKGSSSLRIGPINDNYQRALLACYDLYGTAPMFYPTDKPDPKYIHQRNINRSVYELKNYKKSGFDQYISSCVYDTQTCEICARHDGVVYNIKKAVIGENCPPFHPGCRCCISPKFADSWRPKTKFCRNPVTMKSDYTTAHTYSEWEQSLSDEERKALREKRNW